MKQSFWLCFLALLVAALFILPGVFAVVQPSGATLTQISNQTMAPDAAGSQAAIAGNVTEMNLYGYTDTQAWQGYYGNVSGTIQLVDGSDNVLYNWSDANPLGQVYSSTNSTIHWLHVQCFNFTAKGTPGNITDTGETPGLTNKKGMNLTQLQNEFGIGANDFDSVNNTFYLLGNSSSSVHSTFYTANLEFNGSECQTSRIYDNSGTGVAGHFEEVIQYEPTTSSVIWTSILNRNLLGFDKKQHDFEMLVPENGHKTNTATTTYYFYVQLQ